MPKCTASATRVAATTRERPYLTRVLLLSLIGQTGSRCIGSPLITSPGSRVFSLSHPRGARSRPFLGLLRKNLSRRWEGSRQSFGLFTEIDHSPTGETLQESRGNRKHTGGRSRGSIDNLETQQVTVDVDGQGPLVPHRRDSADGESSDSTDQIGIRLGDV